MLRTLFVRGVPRTVDEEGFAKLFERLEGVLRSFLIHGERDHKGIGFVEFDTSRHAEAAMKELNGKKIGGRELKIEFAKDRESFRERKKRKIQSLKTEPSGVDEKSFFENLGLHSRIKTIAVGGITDEILQSIKEKAESIGKVNSFTYPTPKEIVVSARLEEDGCPAGVILITYDEVKQAMKAVEVLHGLEVAGSSSRKLWSRQIAGEGAQIHKNKIIIRNLPPRVHEEDIKELVSPAGFVWRLSIPRKSKGQSFGYAFVHFTTHAEAEKAIGLAHGKVRNLVHKTGVKFNLKSLDGRSVVADWAGAASNNVLLNQEENKKITITPVEESGAVGANFTPAESKEEALKKTLFVSGLTLDITEENLSTYMAQFGSLNSVKIVQNKLTGKSKGTAFVEFCQEEDKEKALENLNRIQKTSGGLSFSVKPALSRESVKSTMLKRKQEKHKADRRNLYLLQEGRIEEASELWKSLSKTDQEIRKRSEKLKKEKLKNPVFFVSKTRLCIRNLPGWMTENQLETLIIDSIKTRATRADPHVCQVKLLYDDSPKGRSLQRGFIELDLHEHALCALRVLNANPTFFGPQRRPIVEFAIDNKEIINKRDQLIHKLRQEAKEKGKVIDDVSFGFGKKKRKGRRERLKAKSQSLTRNQSLI